MNQSERAKEWARNYHAQLSPQSRLGSLAGAARDGVLSDVLKILQIATAVQLVEHLHQQDMVDDYKKHEAYR